MVLNGRPVGVLPAHKLRGNHLGRERWNEMSSSKISSGEVGNIVGLEHVNVCVADQQTAFHFYVEGLGFVRDKEYQTGLENMWANLGPTQFHLPIGTPQVLRGHVGVVVPDREALLRRLAQLE